MISVPASIISKSATPGPHSFKVKSNMREKSNIELKSELADLKKQRNKDSEDVRILKVELGKLEQIWKKYKTTIPKGSN